VAAYFLDTSTVVKRYVLETGTPWVQALTDPAAGHFLFVARITELEMTAAIARRRRLGSLTPAQAATALAAFRQDFDQQYRIMEISIPLLQQSSQLADRYVLRAYDAVQLAAAVALNSQWIAAGAGTITLVSADQELNAAALAEGLTVDDPNMHP
jgi:predicted nucleic acid-binding protein